MNPEERNMEVNYDHKYTKMDFKGSKMWALGEKSQKIYRNYFNLGIFETKPTL